MVGTRPLESTGGVLEGTGVGKPPLATAGDKLMKEGALPHIAGQAPCCGRQLTPRRVPLPCLGFAELVCSCPGIEASSVYQVVFTAATQKRRDLITAAVQGCSQRVCRIVHTATLPEDGHFPLAAIGGTLSVDLRSRDLHGRHGRRGSISIDGHREKR